MKSLFDVINLNDKEKIGNLNVEAHSKVKSTKYFPIYLIDGKKMIFKPLSKTKPLTTPFFAYSEVYWSYIIKNYFDGNTPRYYLANANIYDENSKYYNQGVLVEMLNQNNEKIFNLYDYFNENPDVNVDIKNYTNYCMKNYDYTKILSSEFIKNNKEIGEGLAFQILLSILRQDQNFHYENVNFIDNEQELLLAPPIDFEFSTFFLYPDKEKSYKDEKTKYINDINIKYDLNDEDKMHKDLCSFLGMSYATTINKNISTIIKLYPNVVLRFIKILEKFIKDFSTIIFSDNNNYIDLLNSDYWKVGYAYFKENDINKYIELKDKITLEKVDKQIIFDRISSDVLEFSKLFNLVLKIYLTSYSYGIEDLECLTIKQLLDKLNINDYMTIKDIAIDTKEIKFTKIRK